MKRSLRTLIAVALLSALLLPVAASAHEHRDVGQYKFVVGFINEPAFEGEQNGIWVSITDKTTQTPMENLAETLKAQVIYGEQQLDLALEPAWNEKGVYTADFYPTSAGDYTFRFFGDINGTAIDETFTSSPEGFSRVQPTTALQFPAKVPAATELSAELAAARSMALTATILGGASLAFGLISLLAALGALRGRRTPAALDERSAART
ncbi:MAG: hypothetical protein M3R24_20165 [Chloroflexota bacterium]|nr:hypothetical protein [Chloroflexota bacterium]